MTTMGELLFRTTHPAGTGRRPGQRPSAGPTAVVDAALALVSGTSGPSKEHAEDVLLALGAAVGDDLSPAARGTLSEALLDVATSPTLDRRALVDRLLDIRRCTAAQRAAHVGPGEPADRPTWWGVV
jgi:hypothetical protein